MAFDLSNYTEVKDRIPLFLTDYPDGRIVTDMLRLEPPLVVFRAELYRDHEATVPMAVGHAYEKEGQGSVNRGSYIENCETSAIGRALANANYTGNGQRPSREEMVSGANTAAATDAAKPKRRPRKRTPEVEKLIADINVKTARLLGLEQAREDAGGEGEPLITDEQATRLTGALASNDPDRMKKAIAWLDGQTEKAKLTGAAT